MSPFWFNIIIMEIMMKIQYILYRSLSLLSQSVAIRMPDFNQDDGDRGDDNRPDKICSP